MAVTPLPNDAPAMRDLDALREVRAGGELIGRHRQGRLLGSRRPANNGYGVLVTPVVLGAP